VIHTTDALTKVTGTPHKLAQVLRDTFIPMVSRLAPFHHAFVQRLSELGVRYEGSPIVEGSGERYFDDSIRGGNGIGRRFLLLMSASDSAAREGAGDLVESFPSALELRPSSRPGLTLVRPDGYIAYTNDRAGAFALSPIRALLERQVGHGNVATLF